MTSPSREGSFTVSTVSPTNERSTYIRSANFERYRFHQGVGDMWPVTWAEDDNLYTAGGDNRGSAMNFWRMTVVNTDDRVPTAEKGFQPWDMKFDVIDDMPLDPAVYCTHPLVHHKAGLKPAGLIDLGGRLHLAVEAHNYGMDPNFNRQTNIQGWIITTDDYGKTWDRDATSQESFFSGRTCSCHFLQYGKGGATPDGWLYAYFPGASDDGNAYWCNGDYVLLGRVRPENVLNRAAWEFLADVGSLSWSTDDADATPIFEYPRMTGENHVSYNAGIGRYLMGNFSFLTPDGKPRPYHQDFPASTLRSQLTLLESPTPWGPWTVFHQDDDWGTYGDYQPSFPVNWMSADGKTMFMVSSGSYDDYNLTVQRVDLELFSEVVE